MSDDQLKQALCAIINSEGTINAMDLVVRVTKELVQDISLEQIFIALDSLVQEKKIIEVEYTLPFMNYRVKSLYFPKGTEINITGK